MLIEAYRPPSDYRSQIRSQYINEGNNQDKGQLISEEQLPLPRSIRPHLYRFRSWNREEKEPPQATASPFKTHEAQTLARVSFHIIAGFLCQGSVRSFSESDWTFICIWWIANTVQHAQLNNYSSRALMTIKARHCLSAVAAEKWLGPIAAECQAYCITCTSETQTALGDIKQ